jgi:hypothetical protein
MPNRSINSAIINYDLVNADLALPGFQKRLAVRVGSVVEPQVMDLFQHVHILLPDFFATESLDYD